MFPRALRALAATLAFALASALLPFAAAAQHRNPHLIRAQQLYLDVEFDAAVAELRAALIDTGLGRLERRDALMLLGTIQVAQGQLTAATRTFAEVRVRWPDYEPSRDVPPNARQVFSAVPETEIARVHDLIQPEETPGDTGLPPPVWHPPRHDEEAGGIPLPLLIGGGAAIVAVIVIVSVIVLTHDDRSTVIVNFRD